MMYFLYALGKVLMNILPLNAGYWLASRVADIKYFCSIRDKRIVIDNLKVILGENDGRKLRPYARAVFRNFCKYLVEFLRQDRVDEAYIKRSVKIGGVEYLEGAFKKGRGVVILSAHLGNWELGAAVTAMLGYPLNIIALSHKDKRVNDFFDQRRRLKGAKIIPVGGSVKKAFMALDKNEAVAILGDRDFSKSDLVVKFFGKDAVMPKGVGIFKLRKDAVIIPCFMVRMPDNTYSLTFHRPIEYSPTGNDTEDMKGSVEASLKILEEYIKRFPDQWSMFDCIWPERKA